MAVLERGGRVGIQPRRGPGAGGSHLDVIVVPAARQELDGSSSYGKVRLGAMVFGGVDTEVLAPNEEALWSGPPTRDWNNPEARQYLAQVRHLLLEEHDYARRRRSGSRMEGRPSDARRTPIRRGRPAQAESAARPAYRLGAGWESAPDARHSSGRHDRHDAARGKAIRTAFRVRWLSSGCRCRTQISRGLALPVD